ncbi:MAG: LSm family protein [Candidatus Pacearchaeota archaeon]
MENNINRPLDILNKSKGKEIIIYLKNDRKIVGKLLAFDIHINLVLEDTKEIENDKVKNKLGLAFIRGDTILYISPVV